MLIDLTGKVVILDEAHNIEDSAREAASLSVTNFQLEEVTSELEDLSELGGQPESWGAASELGVFKA